MAPGGSSRQLKLKWDTAKRQVLCCMFKFFSNKNTFAPIFSEIFRDHLEERQISGSVTLPVLNAQWYWMRQNGNPIWRHVHMDTDSRLDGELKEIVKNIEEVSSRLGLSPRPKMHNEKDTSEQRGLELGEGMRNDLESQTVPETDIDNTDASGGTDELKVNQNTNPVNGNGKFCYWCFKEGIDCSQPSLDLQEQSAPATQQEDSGHIDTSIIINLSTSGSKLQSDFPGVEVAIDANGKKGLPGRCSPSQLPPILFRWANVLSQGINSKTLIRAGLFSKDELESPPLNLDEMSERKFLRFFVNHVTKAKVPSPFISTCRLPLAPVQRASQNQRRARVTIIDPSKLNTMVTSAYSLVPLTRTRTAKWDGRGEYLVWKEIPEAAIICGFDIDDLERIAREFPDIGAFLQLDLIWSSKFVDRSLYLQLARNVEAITDPRRTIERLLTLLHVPTDYHKTLIDVFETAWMAKSLDRLNAELSGDRPDSPGRVDRFYQGEPEFDPDFHPSQTESSNTDDDEQKSQLDMDSEPEAHCPRLDTPSEAWSAEDSLDEY